MNHNSHVIKLANVNYGHYVRKFIFLNEIKLTFVNFSELYCNLIFGVGGTMTTLVHQVRFLLLFI